MHKKKKKKKSFLDKNFIKLKEKKTLQNLSFGSEF